MLSLLLAFCLKESFAFKCEASVTLITADRFSSFFSSQSNTLRCSVEVNWATWAKITP